MKIININIMIFDKVVLPDVIWIQIVFGLQTELISVFICMLEFSVVDVWIFIVVSSSPGS